MVRAAFFDLSGTLHTEFGAVPGAVEGLKALRANSNLEFRFLTNTTTQSPQALLRKLQGYGFEIREEELFTPLQAVRQYLLQKKLRPMLFLEPEAQRFFSDVSIDPPNAVVVGLAPNMLDYTNLNKAFHVLQVHPNLIALHRNLHFKGRGKDHVDLGPGPFIHALELAASCQAKVIGKPEPTFYQLAIDSLSNSIQPHDIVMIGDDPINDYDGALAMGMQAILVTPSCPLSWLSLLDT